MPILRSHRHQTHGVMQQLYHFREQETNFFLAPLELTSEKSDAIGRKHHDLQKWRRLMRAYTVPALMQGPL